MRKILYLQWDCFCEEYICASFQKAGFEVEMYPIPYGKTSMRRDEAFEAKLTEHIASDAYEFVFSFNYFPAVALAVQAAVEQKPTAGQQSGTANPAAVEQKPTAGQQGETANQAVAKQDTGGVKYVSWTYDSPFMYLYSKTIMLPCNVAFCFDKATVDELQAKGVTTVHYLPMAAPVDIYDRIYSSSKNRSDFGADISFVGSMYTEARQALMKNLSGADAEVQQYMETLINLQLQSYAVPILEQFLQPQIIAKLQQVCPIPIEEDEMQSEAWMYANYFLARETTARERTQIISALSQKYQLKLYTPEVTPHIPAADNRGPVDYCDGMPLVFKNSKINLNISLKSIYSGIPLRAFDIMGCGGFLISDFQADFGGLFVPDEDYVFYTTPEDLYAKVDFYLEHEDKRNQIAVNGYEKVKEKHTYDIRVREILNRL